MTDPAGQTAQHSLSQAQWHPLQRIAGELSI